MNRKYFQQRNELAIKLIRELYRHIDGREISLQGRKNIRDHQSLTYGEIVPQSFLQILSSIITPSLSSSSLSSTQHSSPHKVFVDLGCGVGVPVMIAALSGFQFSKVWGIELLPELAEAAISVPKLLNNYLQQSQSPSHLHHSDEKSSSPPKVSQDLNQIIERIFQEIQSRRIRIESLVDHICKRVGHKEYKKLLKGFKSFKKFLSSHPTRYQVVGEDVTFISLNFSGTIDEDHESEDLHTAESRRQTRPEVILSLLSTPTGQTLCNEGALPDIVIECNDIFTLNWSDEADVVYCASLLFSDEMMSRLLEMVWQMKSDSYFISLKPFVSPHHTQGNILSEFDNGHGRHLTLISDSFYRMSWQMARVYIYQVGPRHVIIDAKESLES